MSKEQLNGADVSSVLQQVHGEGVPHGMRSDRFGNFANAVGFLAFVLNRGPADVLTGRIAGKKPVLRPLGPPPLSQDLQQLRGEHHVAVLHSFALLDPHDHALAVDGRHCKGDALGDAQACSVTGGQDGSVLPAGNTGKKLQDFLGTKHDRQGLRLFRSGDDLFEGPVLLESDLIQEAECGNGNQDRTGR